MTGGVVAGLLFGKSVLSHVWPAGFAWLGGSHAAWALVDGYAMVASLLLLAIGGLEVDLSVVRRRGRSALPLVTLGILTPLGAGALLSLAVAPAGAAGAVGPVAFAALLGVALTVSALPVIARTLADLGLFKTDVGLLVMAAASAGDVFGWLAFCVVLAVSRGAHPPGLAWALGGSALFAVACVQIGKRLLDRALARIDADPERARVAPRGCWSSRPSSRRAPPSPPASAPCSAPSSSESPSATRRACACGRASGSVSSS